MTDDLREVSGSNRRQEFLAATGKRKIHEVCWINMVTTELDQVEEFLGQLLGWTYADGVPGGHLIQVGGLPAGDLMDQAVFPPEIPVSIGILIKVANAEASDPSAGVRVNGEAQGTA